MRIVGSILAVMMLVPLTALAQTHSSNVTIDGDLAVWGEEAVVGDTSGLRPYFFFTGQNNHVVYVRQASATSVAYPYSGFIFSNNQTGTSSSNIAQLMFCNEAIGVSDKRVAQILAQTDGAVDSGKMIFRTFDAGSGTNTLALYSDGRVRVADEMSCKVAEIRGGSDVAQLFDVCGALVVPKPGMVVSIDAKKPGALTVSSKAYDRTVAGIIAGAGALKPGMLMGQEGTLAYGDHPVTLSGRVYCYVDATKAPVVPGDLLTTSDVAGHAMKVTHHAKAQGAIIGKAMTGLDSGRGLVMVLVSLQ